MKVEVKEVKFFPLAPNEKGRVGVTSFVIDGRFKVQGVGVFTRLDGSGFRLVYPVIRLPHGLMVESFCPIDKETALDLTNAVVDKIDKIAKGSKRGPESTYYVPYLDE